MFSRKTRVILDTNALLLPAKGIDIFTLIHQAVNEPYKLATYKNNLDELERLAQKKTKDAFAAKLGYILAKQKDLKTLYCSSRTHPDDIIVEQALPKSTIVVTQDKGLIKRLQDKGVRVLRYQQKKLVFQ